MNATAEPIDALTLDRSGPAGVTAAVFNADLGPGYELPALGEDRPKEKLGFPVRYFMKPSLKVGQVADTPGGRITITKEALEVADKYTRQWMKDGGKPFVPKRHENFDAHSNLGWLRGSKFDGETLWLEHELIGEDAHLAAARGDSSVMLRWNFNHGGKVYPLIIEHNAILPDPKMRGLGDFVALSREGAEPEKVPVYTFAAEPVADPPAPPQPPTRPLPPHPASRALAFARPESRALAFARGSFGDEGYFRTIEGEVVFFHGTPGHGFPDSASLAHLHANRQQAKVLTKDGTKTITVEPDKGGHRVTESGPGAGQHASTWHPNAAAAARDANSRAGHAEAAAKANGSHVATLRREAGPMPAGHARYSVRETQGEDGKPAAYLIDHKSGGVMRPAGSVVRHYEDAADAHALAARMNARESGVGSRALETAAKAPEKAAAVSPRAALERAVADLNAGGRRMWISDVRERMAAHGVTDRAEQDQAITEATMAGDAVPVRMDNPMEGTPARKAGEYRTPSGEDRHLLYWTGKGGTAPAPATPSRALQTQTPGIPGGVGGISRDVPSLAMETAAPAAPAASTAERAKAIGEKMAGGPVKIHTTAGIHEYGTEKVGGGYRDYSKHPSGAKLAGRVADTEAGARAVAAVRAANAEADVIRQGVHQGTTGKARRAAMSRALELKL